MFMSNETHARKPEDRNSLSSAQMFTAAKFLEAERETVLRDRPTLPQLAKFLSDRCGFALTVSNAKNIKAMTGISWEAKIATRNVKIRKDVKALAVAIREIAAGLGMALSNDDAIKEIADRKK